jgi:hypothetical protein
MSLAKRNEREYLEITEAEGSFSITAKPRHAEDLSALLTLHGHPHSRKRSSDLGAEELCFNNPSDRPKIAEVLTSYKNVRGS